MKSGKNLKIFWLKLARLDLHDIRDYISQDNPEAAVKTILNIIDAVEKLSILPEIGKPGRVKNTRELIISGIPYTVPYRIKGDRIEILRVLHQARKFPERL
jgi:addiction module RelE/StbE family toxin